MKRCFCSSLAQVLTFTARQVGMKQDGTMALFQYWNRLRGSRPAPRRSEIEPADIKALLADTFILEKLSQGDAVFRLAGTRLCSTYGKELKGHAFSSLWSAKDQQAVGRLARQALEDKSVVVFTFQGVSRDGRGNDFELIILPLDGGDACPRALGAVQSLRKPYWLGAVPIAENRLETFRFIDPDREPLFLKNRPAVPVPPLLPDGDALTDRLDSVNGRRIRHLVVLKGGRDG
jgi:hypothetical protein